MSIGEHIKEIRLSKGLTQKQLGELCGMSESMIRQYELGYRNPKRETIEKIADALGCQITDIEESILVKRLSVFANRLHQLSLGHDLTQIELLDDKTIKVNNLFEQLNDIGQDKAIDQVELLTKIPEYQKSPEE